MKNLFNNMDSYEIGRILEMHKRQGYSLSEQNAVLNDKLPPKFRDPEGKDRTGIPGSDDDSKQGGLRPKDIAIPQYIDLGSSLFKNGIANIDTSNTGYKAAITKLKELPSGEPVDVTGGASAVGSKTFGKEQNQKLAMLRASNFIKAAKSDGVRATMTPSGKVGVETLKDSPAAEKEQFVKIEYVKRGRSDMTTDLDNLRVDKKIPGGLEKVIKGGGGSLYKMCIGDLTVTEYKELLKRFKSKIKSTSIQ